MMSFRSLLYFSSLALGLSACFETELPSAKEEIGSLEDARAESKSKEPVEPEEILDEDPVPSAPPASGPDDGDSPPDPGSDDSPDLNPSGPPDEPTDWSPSSPNPPDDSVDDNVVDVDVFEIEVPNQLRTWDQSFRGEISFEDSSRIFNYLARENSNLSNASSLENFVRLWVQQSLPNSGLPFELQLRSERRLRNGELIQLDFEQWISNLAVEASHLRLTVRRVGDSFKLLAASVQLAPSVSFDFPIPQEPSSIAVLENIVAADSLVLRRVDRGVWYNFDSSDAPAPRPVWKLTAGDSLTQAVRLKTYFVDMQTGELLHTRQESLHFNSEGQVRGLASQDIFPDLDRYELALQAMANLRVETPDEDTHTSVSGLFNLPDPSGAAHALSASLVSDVIGRGILVFDHISGGTPALTTNISANVTGLNFIFNQTPSYNITAALNAFSGVEKSYRYYADRAAIAALDSQTLRVEVNRNDETCNASYTPDLDDDSPALLYFYVEANGCVNSAYSTVVAHEYGHHVVNRLGLAQGAFGEGYADTLAMLLYDSEGVGFDFSMDEEFLRSAPAEDVQWPCEGGIYTCGSVMGALFWDLRIALGLEAARQLHVDWSQVTAGGVGTNAIHPQSVIELLIADDDNADLLDGTPRWAVICDAVEKRNLSCPELLILDYDADVPASIFPADQLNVSIVVSAGLASPLDSSAILYYRINGGAWVQLVMTRTAAHTYNVDLPALEEGDVIEFYVSVMTTGGLTQNFASRSVEVLSPYPAAISYSMPKKPVKVLSADQQTRLGGNSSVFVLTDQSQPGLLEFSSATLAENRSRIARIPDGFSPGAGSLFYRKNDTSTDFFLTNHSRTEVYWGQSAGLDPVFIQTKCSGFNWISDIHLADTPTDPERLVVVDQGAQKIISFALDNTTSEFCTDRQEMNLSGVQWVRSPNLANGAPLIYVGNRADDGVRIRLLDAASMSSEAPAIHLSSSPFSEFRGVTVDPANSRLIVGVTKAMGSPRGEDFIYETFAGIFALDVSAPTCRAPDEIRTDFTGGTRYRYVLCKVPKIIQIFDENQNLLASLPAGASPRQMLVGSDGTDRWVAVLQNNASLLLHEFPSASAQILADISSTNIALPAASNQMALFASLDGAILSSFDSRQVFHVDFGTASVVGEYRFPQSVEQIMVEGANLGSVTSLDAESAYRLSFPGLGGAGDLEFTNLLGRPIQVEGRTNRNYILTQNENRLSIVNTLAKTVAHFPVGDRPMHFEWSAARNELWVANRDSQSISIFDITVGSEALDAVLPVGFRAQRIAYEPNGDRLYVGGDQTLRVYNPDTLAQVASYTLPGRITEIEPISFNNGSAQNGVMVTSEDNWDVHFVTPSAASRIILEGSPRRMAVNGDLAVFSLQNQNKLQLVDMSDLTTSQTQTDSLSRFFDLGNLFATFGEMSQNLRFYPFSGLSQGNFPAIEFLDNPVVDQAASDSGDNIWTLDKNQARLQRFDSQLQPEIYSNVLLNRPVDILANSWDDEDRLYVLLRNMSAVMILDLPSGSLVQIYQVCSSPRKMLLDNRAANRKLFVQCTRESAISVLDLDADGEITDSSLWPTLSKPSAMYRHDNILYVASQASNAVQSFNASTGAQIWAATVENEPVGFAPDVANDLLYVISQGSEDFSVIDVDANTVLADPLSVARVGMRQGAVNPNSGLLYSVAPTPPNVYLGGLLDYQQDGDFELTFFPQHVSASPNEDKMFVSYPDDNLLQVFDETERETRQIEVGEGPVESRSVGSVGAPRLYISLEEANEVVVMNPETEAILSRATLTDSCRPNRIESWTNYVFVLCQQKDLVEVFDLSGGDARIGSFSLRVP